ncbi:MAG: hypothetical protein WBP41_15405 [Saprospiraceae bacterium]
MKIFTQKIFSVYCNTYKLIAVVWSFLQQPDAGENSCIGVSILRGRRRKLLHRLFVLLRHESGILLSGIRHPFFIE